MLGASLVGVLVGGYHLAKEWESEEEKMKMIGRSDDQWAIQFSDEGGWKSLVGRAFIRGEDYMDVSFATHGESDRAVSDL